MKWASECSTPKEVRKILSILLLAIFGLPLVVPLMAFGADGDAGLPACCRKNGKHHCTQSVGERSQFDHLGTGFSRLPEKCPYCPGAIVAEYSGVLAAPASAAIFASLVSQPTGIAQTESKRRISRDRSRQKRGPPADLL